MNIVLLGDKGRDDAMADRLRGHRLHVLGQYKNPGLVEKSLLSGGQFHLIDSNKNIVLIADIVQSIKPDMFITNFDDSLAAGVVDELKKRVLDKRIPDLLIPCPSKDAARIEWDKFYLRELIDEINPRYNPINFMATTTKVVSDAINFFQKKHIQVAIKPRNLAGGKGVKVMGKHFSSYKDAKGYALSILSSGSQTGVEIQEKILGPEFTLQIFTDGQIIIRPPETYDYPYREDGNTGPGTGGMGAFSMRRHKRLPFLTQEEYDATIVLMERVLVKLREKGLDYKGVLYPTFFKTPDGLKIVEINARGGDPEFINILDLLEDGIDLGNVLKSIAEGNLTQDSIKYKDQASAMIYLVSPDYCYRSGEVYNFFLNSELVKNLGVKIRFGAAELVKGNHFKTVGASRTVGLSALGETPWAARKKIHTAITEGFNQPLTLQFRNQIADRDYIKRLVE
jgi:phosphoribosylamine--glycine ligase